MPEWHQYYGVSGVMQRYGLVGAGGYVAPRHMRAIKETGGDLVIALDKNDSVGVIDSYFPECHFFTEFERFDRRVDLLRRRGEPIDWLTVCSPNYLHDAHARFGLRSGANVICEKPLALNPWNLDGLSDLEKETGKRVYTILQLRLHPNIVALKARIDSAEQTVKHDVDLAYITSRGRWYHVSWKGDVKKSGGIATNIGVHFFDMLHFLFGDLQVNQLHHDSESTAAGYLEYEKARVRWFLSVDAGTLPSNAIEQGQRTYRRVSIDGEDVEFSGGFTDLHTASYQGILAGNGFGIEDNRAAIDAVSAIRRMRPIGCAGDYHPFLDKLAK